MRLELRSFDVTLSAPVFASSQAHNVRTHLLLRLEHAGIVGWGEVSPQPLALNGDPSIAEVIDELVTVMVPTFMSACNREGEVPHWSRVTRFQGSRAASPTAAALVESATLDWTLRQERRGILDLWPVVHNTPTMVSLPADVSQWVVPDCSAQVRWKASPAPIDPAVVEALTALAVPVLLDYNCSLPAREDIYHHLNQLASVPIAAIEQPFQPGNVVDHALLAKDIDVSLSLDEGIRSRRDVENVARYDAASLICIKPARVGGLSVARTCATRALELGITPYLGGFFESPLGRIVNAALARTCVAAPSDIGRVVFLENDEWRGDNVGVGISPTESLWERSQPIFDHAVQA